MNKQHAFGIPHKQDNAFAIHGKSAHKPKDVSQGSITANLLKAASSKGSQPVIRRKNVKAD